MRATVHTMRIPVYGMSTLMHTYVILMLGMLGCVHSMRIVTYTMSIILHTMSIPVHTMHTVFHYFASFTPTRSAHKSTLKRLGGP